MKIALGIAKDHVQMFLDETGRDALVEFLKELEFPKDTKSHEHLHLFSEEWGGYDLSHLNDASRKKFELDPVHHLKVYMRPEHNDVWA